MKRKKGTPGIKLYYEVLQDLFCRHSKVLTAVLTHYGERGRNDEEQLRQFLYRVLPRRFSIGTGFIVSSETDKKPSGQTDIIVSDQFWNSPLYRELAADVYPIETVYATIEVKGTLAKNARGGKEKKPDLDSAFEQIATVRDLAKSKKYVKVTVRPKTETETDKPVVWFEEYTIALPPRSYIFAYAQEGWKNIEDFRSQLSEKLQEHPSAHIHGIVVLEKNWFAFQEAYTGDDVEIHAFDDNALLRFTNTLLRGIQGMPMNIASIDNYHRAGLLDSFLAGNPSESGYLGDPEPSNPWLEKQ